MTDSFRKVSPIFILEIGFNKKTNEWYIQKIFRKRTSRFSKKYKSELEAYKGALRHSNNYTCVGLEDD